MAKKNGNASPNNFELSEELKELDKDWRYFTSRKHVEGEIDRLFIVFEDRMQVGIDQNKGHIYYRELNIVVDRLLSYVLRNSNPKDRRILREMIRKRLEGIGITDYSGFSELVESQLSEKTRFSRSMVDVFNYKFVHDYVSLIVERLGKKKALKDVEKLKEFFNKEMTDEGVLPNSLRVIGEHGIKRTITMERAFVLMDEAFGQYSSNKIICDIRTETERGENTYLTMPAWVEKGWGPLKKVTVISSKTVEIVGRPHGSSPRIGAAILFIPESREYLMIAPGTYITALRTGASVGLATGMYGKKNAKTVGIFGSQWGAALDLLGVWTARPGIEQVKICSWTDKNAERFADKDVYTEIYEDIIGTKGISGNVTYRHKYRGGEEKEIPVKPLNDVAKMLDQIEIVPYKQKEHNEVAADSDIIICATSADKPTPREPVFDGDVVKKDAHINAVGAWKPDIRELDPWLIQNGRIVVDSMDECLGGQLGPALNKYGISPRNKGEWGIGTGDLVLPYENSKDREEYGIDKGEWVDAVGKHLMGEIGSKRLRYGPRVSKIRDGISIFETVGVGAQDYMVAKLLSAMSDEDIIIGRWYDLPFVKERFLERLDVIEERRAGGGSLMF